MIALSVAAASSQSGSQENALPSSEGTAGASAAEALEVMDLDTAQRLAIADNPSLKAAEARVRQARARVKQAQALWYPSIDVTASASNTWLSERSYAGARLQAIQPGWSQFVSTTQTRLEARILSDVAGLLGITVQSQQSLGSGNLNQLIFRDLRDSAISTVYARRSIDDSVEDYRVSLTASWIVFNGFERKFANAEARFGFMETEAAYLEAHRLLLSAVAQAYHAAQLARENVAIAESDIAFNERQLTEAKARLRVGSGSLSDELNFEVRVNASKASVISSRQEYRTALIALAELLALPEAAFPESKQLAPLTAEALNDLQAPDSGVLVALGVRQRPDMLQQELAVKRRKAGIGRNKAPFYPTIVAQASKDASRSSDARFGEDDFGATVGVNVQYNLFAGGGDVARLKEAKAAHAEAEWNAVETELAVASDVRQRVEELKAAQDQLVLQRANAAFVQQNRDLVEHEYAAGEGSLVRLNEAQRDLITAQGNLAFARVNLRQAWHNLRTATAETVSAYTAAPPHITSSKTKAQ
jgi:outer membrane protein TolC